MLKNDIMSSLKELKQIELYFTVTTGRSGTAFLAKYIAGMGKGIYAAHEPLPQFHPVMRRALFDSSVARDFWVNQKAPAITRLAVMKYVETTHLICKGFLETLFEEGIYPNLILLKRKHRDVAKSLYYLNTIPGRTEAGLKYYLKPDDPGVMLPIKNWEKLSDYQLCYWYTLEIEKRQNYYAEVVVRHGGRVMELNFDDLMSGRKYNDLLIFFNLPKSGLLKRLLMKLRTYVKVNAKTRRKLKKSVTSSISFGEEEARLTEILVDNGFCL